jgi:hypothetical protein
MYVQNMFSTFAHMHNIVTTAPFYRFDTERMYMQTKSFDRVVQDMPKQHIIAEKAELPENGRKSIDTCMSDTDSFTWVHSHDYCEYTP